MVLCAEAGDTACFKEYFLDLLQADLLVSDTQETLEKKNLLQYITIIVVNLWFVLFI